MWSVVGEEEREITALTLSRKKSSFFLAGLKEGHVGERPAARKQPWPKG